MPEFGRILKYRLPLPLKCDCTEQLAARLFCLFHIKGMRSCCSLLKNCGSLVTSFRVLVTLIHVTNVNCASLKWGRLSHLQKQNTGFVSGFFFLKQKFSDIYWEKIFFLSGSIPEDQPSVDSRHREVFPEFVSVIKTKA